MPFHFSGWRTPQWLQRSSSFLHATCWSAVSDHETGGPCLLALYVHIHIRGAGWYLTGQNLLLLWRRAEHTQSSAPLWSFLLYKQPHKPQDSIGLWTLTTCSIWSLVIACKGCFRRAILWGFCQILRNVTDTSYYSREIILSPKCQFSIRSTEGFREKKGMRVE